MSSLTSFVSPISFLTTSANQVKNTWTERSKKRQLSESLSVRARSFRQMVSLYTSTYPGISTVLIAKTRSPELMRKYSRSSFLLEFLFASLTMDGELFVFRICRKLMVRFALLRAMQFRSIFPKNHPNRVIRSVEWTFHSFSLYPGDPFQPGSFYTNLLFVLVPGLTQKHIPNGLLRNVTDIHKL